MSFAPRAAIVFQNYSLLPWFSALENVRLAVEAGVSGLERAEAARPGYQVPGDRWSEERDRKAAQSVVGRYAPASLDRASVCGRAGLLFLESRSAHWMH